MILNQIDPPENTPVSLAEVKAHMRLSHGFADADAEDGLIAFYLDNAVQAVERRLGQALIERGFELRVGSWDRHGQLTLPIGPVAAIGSLSFAVGGEMVESPSVTLSVSPGRSRQIVSSSGGLPLPSVPMNGEAVLHFDAGYGEMPADVPGELRQAVLILTAHLYSNRGTNESVAMQPGIEALIAPHRAIRI